MKIYVALVFAFHILSVQSRPFLDDLCGSGEDDLVRQPPGRKQEDSSEEKGDFIEFLDSAVELGSTVFGNVIDLFTYNDHSPNPNNGVGTSGNGNWNPTNPPVVHSQNPEQSPVPPVSFIPPRKSPQTPTKNSPPQPPVSTQTPPTVNPSPHPQPHDPSQVTSQTPTESSTPETQTQSPPQKPPSSDTSCTCTPFAKCYDEETSSNLTGTVNDRLRIPATQGNCPDPDEVCCHNLVQPLSPPTNSSSPQPQPPVTPQTSPDDSTQNSSPQPPVTPQTSPDDSTPNSPIVPSVTPQTSQDDSTQNSPTEPIGTPQTIPEDSTQSPPIAPELTDTPLNFPEDYTQSPSLEPKPTIVPDSEFFPSDVNCTCTPFFRCYDEETSSNLNGIVDDRTSGTVIQKSCLVPTEVCCYNLVEPLLTQSTNSPIPTLNPSQPPVETITQGSKVRPVQVNL